MLYVGPFKLDKLISIKYNAEMRWSYSGVLLTRQMKHFTQSGKGLPKQARYEHFSQSRLHLAFWHKSTWTRIMIQNYSRLIGIEGHFVIDGVYYHFTINDKNFSAPYTITATAAAAAAASI